MIMFIDMATSVEDTHYGLIKEALDLPSEEPTTPILVSPYLYLAGLWWMSG